MSVFTPGGKNMIHDFIQISINGTATYPISEIAPHFYDRLHSIFAAGAFSVIILTRKELMQPWNTYIWLLLSFDVCVCVCSRVLI